VVQGQNLEVAERSFVDCEHKQEHEECISQQPFASIIEQAKLCGRHRFGLLLR
jgi:hypothetical protein